jgi:hypothetical protein
MTWAPGEGRRDGQAHLVDDVEIRRSTTRLAYGEPPRLDHEFFETIDEVKDFNGNNRTCVYDRAGGVLLLIASLTC